MKIKVLHRLAHVFFTCIALLYDTYVILENLRYFLRGYKSSDPVYCGHHFKTIVQQGYYSGGAGYVLSKEAN
jgi:hypothetical protein